MVQKVLVHFAHQCKKCTSAWPLSARQHEKGICFKQKSWLYPAFAEFLFFPALRQLYFQEILFFRSLIGYILLGPWPHVRHITFVRIIVILRHLFKQIFQIIIWISPVCLCCFNQSKDDSSNLSAAFGKAEKAVPSKLCGRAHRALTSLCEYSDKPVYPNKILIRSFSMDSLEALLLIDTD